MGSIVNAIIKQLIHIFTGGFVSSITSVEIWLFLRIDKFIVHGSLISLSSGWFYQFFQKMEVLALVLILPLFIIGLINGVVSGSGGYLLRLVTLYLPVSLIGSGVLLIGFQALGSAVDVMCRWLIDSQHLSPSSFAQTFSNLSAHGGLADPIPFLLVVIAGIVSVIAALSLYFELLIREGVLVVLAAFIPLILLAMLLSSAKAVVYRFIEISVGVIFSKLAVVVLLCLGAELVTNSGLASNFDQFMIGVAIVILASFSPFLLFSLIPIAHLDHQAQLSGSARRKGRDLMRIGAMAVPGAGIPEIPGPPPLAEATPVPSYLRNSD